jgi:hypothetical protein
MLEDAASRLFIAACCWSVAMARTREKKKEAAAAKNISLFQSRKPQT